MRYDGILAEFEAPRQLSWKSRCQQHRSRPEMLMLANCAPICRRAAGGSLQQRPFSHRRCGIPTASPGGRTTASPSGVVRQRRRTLSRGRADSHKRLGRPLAGIWGGPWSADGHTTAHALLVWCVKWEPDKGYPPRRCVRGPGGPGGLGGAKGGCHDLRGVCFLRYNAG